MSDSSCYIKLKIRLYGKELEEEMYINYYANSGYYGVDQRVLNFFENFYRKSREQYDEELENIRNNEIESEERAELARLKEKYEP